MTQTDSSPAQRQGPEPGNNSSYPGAPYSSSAAPSMATVSTQAAPMQSYSSYPEGQASPPYPYGASNMSSLNLPPIRSIDGRPQQQPPPQPAPPQHQQQQQQQQQPPPPIHHPQQAQQPPAHPGAGQPVPFFSPYPMTHPQAPGQPMRYPLPPNPDGRILSGGRHKKEIKRRTKTGCLTCRKRRIKCDEGHPACRNCQKSKRECLGYDPIFKPQPGTPAIQPAFTQYPAMSHASPAPMSAPPQKYPLAAYGVFVAQEDEQQSPAEKQDPLPEDSIKQENGVEAARANGADPQSWRAKQTKIQDLLCINGVPTLPPAPPSTRTSEEIGQMLKIYELIYQPGMDKFFETEWFKKRGFDYLKSNGPLCDQFQNLISRYSMSDNKEDPTYLFNLAITQSLEAMVIWAMLGLCRKAATTKDAAGNINADDEREDVVNTAKRLDIFEALVTGEYMSAETAPATNPPDAKLVGGTLDKQLTQNQYTFWHNIHRFLTLHNDDPDYQKNVDESLLECRKTLENRESRDVIYSILVVRHIGPTIPGFPNAVKAPETDEEQDAQIGITVAKRLVEEEAGDKGTNQVVTRLCGLAARSWALNSRGTPVTGP